VYVLLEFWLKIITIPIMNPLLWFMIEGDPVLVESTVATMLVTGTQEVDTILHHLP